MKEIAKLECEFKGISALEFPDKYCEKYNLMWPKNRVRPYFIVSYSKNLYAIPFSTRYTEKKKELYKKNKNSISKCWHFENGESKISFLNFTIIFPIIEDFLVDLVLSEKDNQSFINNNHSPERIKKFFLNKFVNTFYQLNKEKRIFPKPYELEVGSKLWNDVIEIQLRKAEYYINIHKANKIKKIVRWNKLINLYKKMGKWN